MIPTLDLQVWTLQEDEMIENMIKHKIHGSGINKSVTTY